ncbi:hypothetical protein EWH99_10760 [Sporolactobacillus sp. THM7-7]|nr:hypothetical protein EWH99_10760 [Sporolactobacillus sp. THM7-7]
MSFNVSYIANRSASDTLIQVKSINFQDKVPNTTTDIIGAFFHSNNFNTVPSPNDPSPIWVELQTVDEYIRLNDKNSYFVKDSTTESGKFPAHMAKYVVPKNASGLKLSYAGYCEGPQNGESVLCTEIYVWNHQTNAWDQLLTEGSEYVNASIDVSLEYIDPSNRRIYFLIKPAFASDSIIKSEVNTDYIEFFYTEKINDVTVVKNCDGPTLFTFHDRNAVIKDGYKLLIGDRKKLLVQIFGSATEFQVDFYGFLISGDKVPIYGINISDLSIVKSTNSNGIYQFDVELLTGFIAVVSKIGSGKISVMGVVK